MSNSTSAASTSFSSSAPSSIVQSSSSAASSSQASESSSIASSVSSAVLAPSTTTVAASSTNVVTSIISASSAAPSTQLITSVVTESQTNGGSTSLQPVTVIVTSQLSAASSAAAAATGTSSSTSASASSTSSSGASLSNNGSNNNSSSSGLSTAGKTAIAVVVPVVVVALLVLAGLYLWRRRKQRKNAEEARRAEVEDYGYNPNNDPTLPAVGTDAPSEMTEDHGSGYRGWGAAAMSNRKASTTLSGGHTQGQLSDDGSIPGYGASPAGALNSDVHSDNTLVNNRSTMNSDDLGALGAAPVAGTNRYDGMKRGPSNASSSYSAGNHSDTSDPSYGQAISSDAYQPNSNYSFSQPGPYGDGSYGGGDGMPIVRDVSARRNTRIEQGGGYQKANSGIAQNF